MVFDTSDPKFWERVWEGVGFLGMGAFTARFLVQWLASERRRETVLPVAFWWFSLTGGLLTLIYVAHLGSRPLMLAQGMGLVVYTRNLMLVRKAGRRGAGKGHRAPARHRPHRIDAPEGAGPRGGPRSGFERGKAG